MISAVVPPQPSPQPPLPNSTPAPNSVRERAAAGYFRDIALWLNEPLVAQGIFVQVQADNRPGCLKLTVEFERAPIRDRLLRFLCHRIWQLNSELIEGIHILARPIGWQRVLWQQRIKIVTPALKRRKANEQLTQAAVVPNGSPLPPKIYTHQPRPQRQNANQRLKTLRAFVLTGSAVAAFVMGCLIEVITSGPSPSLPSFSAQAPNHGERLAAPTATASAPSTEPTPQITHGTATPLVDTPATASPATPVGSAGAATWSPGAVRSPRPNPTNRPSVVDTALEPVGVIAHQKPTPVPPEEVTLLFGGDISLDDLNYTAMESEGGFFAQVEDYFEADVSLVNLATPLATAATSLDEEFHQKTRPEAVEMLVNSGIDIVNLTHSNLMEYGAEGLSETLTALDTQGLYRVGAGRNAMEARRPEILDVKGKRIAYLSYAMGGNNAAIDTTALRERAGAEDAAIAQELENFKQSSAFKERAGFNAQNMPQIVEDLQAIRDQVDWIVVNFRWVDHIEPTPNFVQTNLARLAIDQGADVVVGYHPTVIQGGEVYKGRPIAYSLGDFVFKADQPLQDQDSAVLKVSLQEDKMQVEFVPVRVRNSLPETLSGQEGESVLQRIQQASAQFDQPIQPTTVIDLKAPMAPPPESLTPDSPFVTPEADDTLRIEPDSLTEPEPQAEPDSLTEPAVPSEEAPSESDSPTDSEAKDLILPNPEADPGGSETDSKAEPARPAAEDLPTEDLPTEDLPTIDLQNEIQQELQEWGPKVSPEQREFQPVPQNRSGADEGNQEANLQPSLLRQLITPLRNPNQAGAPTPQVESWSDQVPEVPTPQAAPPLANPSEKAAPQPAEAIPPAPAGAVMTPVELAPTPKVTAPEVKTPGATSPEALEVAPIDTAAPQSTDPEETPEKAVPAPKVIPPQAEPLVGPLGSVETPETVALGSASAAESTETVAPSPAAETP